MARILLRRSEPLVRRLLRPAPPVAFASPSSSSAALGYCNKYFSHAVQLRGLSTEGTEPPKSDENGYREDGTKQKDFALQQALEQITSAFGEESIMWLHHSYNRKEVPVISTGSFALDLALGIGGLPKGRVVEIYGPEASGKTTLALHIIAEAQKCGGYCAFIDAEHALDPALAESIGVNAKHMLLSQPDCGEQALGLADILIRSGSIEVVVVDSVAALVPKTELDGEMGDAHVALQARLMSQALRKLSHSLSRSRTMLVFINQVRSKLSTFSGFGVPAEVTCGGNALKFYASVRLNTRRIGLIKKSEEVIGTQIQVRIVKNKHAPPFRTALLELEFGKGISRELEIIELGCEQKLITKSGLFYHMNGQTFQGKEAIKCYLKENTDVQKDLMAMIREKMMLKESQLDESKEETNLDASLTEQIVSASDEEREIHGELEA